MSRETVLLGAICAADMFLTLALVMTGRAQEANPLLRFYLDYGIGWFIAGKTILFVLPLVALEVIRRRRPVFIRSVLRAGIAIYLLIYGLGVYRINRESILASEALTFVQGGEPSSGF